MAQDIRELFKDDAGIPAEGLRAGHERRFEARLDSEFAKTKNNKEGLYLWLKIAAVLVVLVTVGGVFFGDKIVSNNQQPLEEQVVSTTPKEETPQVQLSDLSPEFKKVEDYYLASINVELSKLKITDDNKALVDSFMSQLEELNKEYQRLNKDLVEIGVNEQTISALIDNLQLRLELLFKLKEKLSELNEGSMTIQSNRA